jgi:glycosyltransferase involved in cell wall biosynthesis
VPLVTKENSRHVVLLAANDITVEQRVLKQAASLVQFGLRVTCVGVASNGVESETDALGARVIRVGVPSRIASWRRNRALIQMSRALAPAYPNREEATLARLRWTLRSQALAARHGRVLLDADRGSPETGLRHVVGQLDRTVRSRGLQGWRKLVYVREGLLNRRVQYRSVVRAQGRERLRPLFLALPALAGWRRVVPEILDYELALGPLIAELQPDVLHVHDVYLIGVAEQAAAHARLNGRRVHLVYDASVYVRGQAIPPARVVKAYSKLEREYIRRYDRVITVSERIADELSRVNRLSRRPDVVLNAPVVAAPEPEGPSVRRAAGVSDHLPLLVYGGGLAKPRGVHTVIQALPKLADVHLAVITRRVSNYTAYLDRIAARLGVADRLHFLPFVSPDQVAHYYASATIGVSSLLHSRNHDWVLTNRLFEFMHARLPIVTSDTPTQAAFVRQLGIGEVYLAGNAQDLARAVRMVLADLDRYRRPLVGESPLIAKYSWDTQAKVLHGVYSGLLGPLPRAPGHISQLRVDIDPVADQR